MLNKIYKRDIVEKIEKYLSTNDIVVLIGARQVGKTYILYWLRDYLKDKNETVYYIDLEDSRIVEILDSGVESFLNHLREEGFLSENSKTFVLIDEIQYLKNPSSFLKLMADHHKNIKLIVSGSSSFEIKNKFKDSLVGRTVNFEIFNLSFKEFLRFKKYHFDEKQIFTKKKKEELLMFFKEYVLYGGYPKIVLTVDVIKKEKYLQQIIDTYIRKDIRDLAMVSDIHKFNYLLEVLASQSGQLLNVTELANTCRIAKQTVERYLFILENTYVIKMVRPYSKNIRSEISKMPKIFFYDSGLMQVLWLKSLQKEIIGNVFETSIFAELVKKYNKENIFYWRTKDKREIYFILKQKDNILPIEVKLNFEQFNSNTIKYFNDNYGLKDYSVVGMKGELKNQNYLYPWEI